MNEGDVVVRDGLQYVEGPDGQLYPQGGVGGLGTFEQDYGSMGSPTEPNPTIGERASSFFGFGPAFERIAENRPTPPAQDMTDLARQSAEDAAKLRETEGITESLKEPTRPQTPEVPVAPQGGGAGAGGAGGAGGMSSFEQELMSTLDRREKAAEQDKWLALAQVGLNMMSSTQPTLLGAVGEAGLKGVEAARGARDQYEKDRIELLGAMEQSRLARAAAAARAASGAQGTQSSGFGGLSASQGRLLTQINSDLTRLDSVLNDPLSVGMELTPEQELEREDAKDKRRQLEFLREQLMYGAALSAGSGDETTADLSD